MKMLLLLMLLVPARAASGQDWHTVNKQSMTLYKEGRYSEAIRAADEALKLAQSAYSINSSEYLASLTNKACAQSARGDHLKALANFRQAARISFGLYALPHASHIEALGELARTFLTLGAYDSAGHYLDLARFTYISVRDKNKAHYDTSAFILSDAYIKINAIDASLHHRKGQVRRAIELLEDQIGWIKELYAEDYEETADYRTSINNISTYYNEIPDLDKAKHYALEYYRLVQKHNHALDLVHALQNLGSLYRNTGRNDSAAYYWHKALARMRSGHYEGTHIHTVILNNLGELKVHTEAYDSAVYFLKSSLAIQRSNEAVHPLLYQTTLFNLAESYHWAGRYAAADSIYTELIDDLLNDIIHNFAYLSDNEKLAFYKNQVSIIEHYTAFALEISGALPLQDTDAPYINAHINGRLYDLPLTTKAIILNASRRMKNNILTSGDTALIKIYSLWEERKNQLAQALTDGRHTAEELKWLKIKIEENEKWLTANSRSFRSGFRFKKITWQQVQRSLKPGEASVEIIRLLDGLIYAALIITPETTRQPVLSLVMSTRSKHLDRQFYQHYHNAITFRLEDTLSYKTYWRPVIDSIKNHMPGRKMPGRVYISNDGIYNRINLNTLYNPEEEQYVLDETEVVVVTNTKELLAPARRTAPAAAARKAALFGRPQFSSRAGGRRLFDDLPGTGREIALIGQVLAEAGWQTQLFTAQHATESNLKKLDNLHVLHLASHGFFSATPGSAENSLAETMVRSGIALAGANDSTHQEDDGLLTAFEVINLNLDSALLVVLSACETARGVANHGEGIYGLQRALRVAGAENMIMSLWRVDDTATQKLMTDFYRRWTQTGDMRTAFRAAQQAIRKAYPDPYYWGPFILAGK